MSVQTIGKQQAKQQGKSRLKQKRGKELTRIPELRGNDLVYVPELILPTEDDQNLESGWHRAQINLFIESIQYHWRDRTDFYAGGNMFIYYDMEAAASKRHSRGPDFYVERLKAKLLELDHGSK